MSKQEPLSNPETKMLVHRWKKPLVIKADGLKFVIGSAEEAMNWLQHQPEKATSKWRQAWEACKAVVEERLNSEKARSVVALAINA
jgi:Protein of unknown function (DUF982)